MGLTSVGTAMGGRLASLDVLHLIAQAGIIVQLVIVLLLALSIISWAIMLYKRRELSRAEQDSEAFLEVYHEGNFEESCDAARELDASPIAAVFLSGYAELKRVARYSGRTVSDAFDDSQVHSVSRHVAWAASHENVRLERGLPFLATVGSSAPFIGLFGTVIGIINAFEGIGQAGSASLAVVAPGIAEALIATAIGLFAAIPATVAYNYFVGELRRLTAAIDLFSVEFTGDLARRRGAAVEPSSARAAGG
jgi:biopolymer transport protein TolQ